MKFDVKEKFNNFLNNTKDYPILSGFSVGFYAFVFYFSNNFDLVNSWQQTFVFLIDFIVFPIMIVFVIFKIIQKSKFSSFAAQGILMMMLFLLPIYLFGIPNLLASYKKMGLLIILFVFLIKFKIHNYKYFIVLVFFMSVLPILKLVKIISLNYLNSVEWKLQPDAILKSEFKKNPNIYYIQPDGYTNEINLKGPLYRFDNSAFDNWLKDRQFTLYDNYRSNYSSTLYSNSSCFFMKHHFSNEFSKFNYARDLIVGKNPVLEIFKNNNYKTFFLTEIPYLLMNRPSVYFDYCNYKLDELPFFKDGLSCYKGITNEIENQIVNNKKTNNFFFIEKFNPGHISNAKKSNSSIEKERIEYIKGLKTANVWLMKTINIIENNDPKAIIIIGADHGGYVGFEYTPQAQNKITNRKLLNSIFGAKLAIKWNDSRHTDYDGQLKTSVNLFRILFSYLSEDKLLLNNLQPNTSYNCYDSTDFSKIYKAIEN
ncbi:hypothetical protein [Flavobacterium soyangense]|uniref:Sulfatase N-terminal domain-containing protein n=1 Tax=Flavobacterium soyangense TaxID=2023265 RepID=A0A930UBH4_9FLAO|nr:hypothetical protein [Flavobacterium soyangense]MBF2708384.1 hypothetical protein [Flavobacterium soyangense]